LDFDEMANLWQVVQLLRLNDREYHELLLVIKNMSKSNFFESKTANCTISSYNLLREFYVIKSCT
jgi:hypothetical protein